MTEKQKQKIWNFKDTNLQQWQHERTIVENELSNNQSMFCVCGKLATGFHEMNCRKFNDKVDIETLKRLKL